MLNIKYTVKLSNGRFPKSQHTYYVCINNKYIMARTKTNCLLMKIHIIERCILRYNLENLKYLISYCTENILDFY